MPTPEIAVTAITALTSLATTVISLVIRSHTKQTHTEVKTSNGSTLAQQVNLIELEVHQVKNGQSLITTVLDEHVRDRRRHVERRKEGFD